jgi:hypothetical protein
MMTLADGTTADPRLPLSSHALGRTSQDLPRSTTRAAMHLVVRCSTRDLHAGRLRRRRHCRAAQGLHRWARDPRERGNRGDPLRCAWTPYQQPFKFYGRCPADEASSSRTSRRPCCGRRWTTSTRSTTTAPSSPSKVNLDDLLDNQIAGVVRVAAITWATTSKSRRRSRPSARSRCR